jgi:hypothetical protein
VNAIRPQPHRGDVIAAGVVVLTALVVLLNLRFASKWGIGVHLAYSAAAAAFVVALAVLSPREGDSPRPYQSILFVATFPLTLYALVNLADALGANEPLTAAGTIVWIGTLVGALMAAFALTRNSAISTLIAALLAGGVLLAFVQWVFEPDGVSTFRWLLAAEALGFAFVARAQRDRRRRHAVQMVNAAGVAVIALMITFAFESLFAILALAFADEEGGFAVAWGWELFVLLAAFALIGYAAVDREPGPGYLGALALLGYVVMAAAPGREGPSLIGWPLVLGALAGTALWVGLRPIRPLPPEPGSDAPLPPTQPMPRIPSR